MIKKKCFVTGVMLWGLLSIAGCYKYKFEGDGPSETSIVATTQTGTAGTGSAPGGETIDPGFEEDDSRYPKLDARELTAEKGHYTVYENPMEQYSLSEVREILECLEGVTISPELSIGPVLPKKIDHVSSFDMYNPERQTDRYEFYTDFMTMMSYLLPGQEVKEEYLSVWGENSNDIYLLRDNYHAMMTGQRMAKTFVYAPYFYYETFPEPGTEYNYDIHLSTPLGAGVTKINLGKAAKFVNVIRSNFQPSDTGRWVASYLPDATESYPMLDGTAATIAEAAQFYEDYVNTLPFPKDPVMDIKVLKVHVYEMKKGAYAYEFTTTWVYEGVPFQAYSGTYSPNEGDTHESVHAYGSMTGKEEVDDMAFQRGMLIKNEKRYDSILPLEEALKLLRQKLSGKITFEVEEVSLEYSQEMINADFSDYEGWYAEVNAQYHVKLYNPNDNRIYQCYINAVDGDKFWYFTQVGRTEEE